MANSDLLTINPGDGFFFSKEERLGDFKQPKPWLVMWGGSLAGSKGSVTVPRLEDKSFDCRSRFPPVLTSCP